MSIFHVYFPWLDSRPVSNNGSQNLSPQNGPINAQGKWAAPQPAYGAPPRRRFISGLAPPPRFSPLLSAKAHEQENDGKLERDSTLPQNDARVRRVEIAGTERSKRDWPFGWLICRRSERTRLRCESGGMRQTCGSLPENVARPRPSWSIRRDDDPVCRCVSSPTAAGFVAGTTGVSSTITYKNQPACDYAK